MNIGFVSLGCAKNLTDTETMMGLLGTDNEIVSDPSEADVIIVNTCGFIESAKKESIDAILDMAKYKSGRCKLLIATGCLAQRYHKEMLTEMPEVDAIVGTGDYDKIAEVIADAEAGGKIVACGDPEREMAHDLPRKISTPPYTAYLKIAEGCDNNCTYCAIPMMRGRYRSRRAEEIVKEAEKLAAGGVKELIVTAQDTTRYGIDIYGKFSLDMLLTKLCAVEGIEWIRVHYFYTEAITDSLIETIAANDKICAYFDMPIQHINDEILRRMARRTNGAEIREKIAAIRAKVKGCTLRTSLIVGFPGETEAQFEELADFVKEARFDRLGVFAYSQEEDTPAAKFPDQIAEEIKESRRRKIMEIQQKISLEKNKEKLGTTLDVLVEGYDEESYLFYGRSRGDSIDIDSKVYFGTDDEVKEGDIIRVEILDADEYDLTGKRVYSAE